MINYVQEIEVFDRDFKGFPDEGLILISCRLYRDIEELVTQQNIPEKSVKEFMINAVTTLGNKHKN